MHISPEIHARGEELQKECHAIIEAKLPATDNDVEYQDLTNAWIFMKLADLELKLEATQRETSDSDR